METPNENQTSPAMPGCAPTAGSDLIEVRMRGGTIIRIPAGRGDGMPYDLLLEALKACQHWDEDEEEWRDGDPFVYLEVIHGQNETSVAQSHDQKSMNTTPTAAVALLPPLSGSLSFDPSDPEIHAILGSPCFWCAPIAHILRAAGHPIKPKAEDEQAAVIVWLIRKYQEGGEGWRKKVDAELNAFRRANETSAATGSERNYHDRN